MKRGSPPEDHDGDAVAGGKQAERLVGAPGDLFERLLHAAAHIEQENEGNRFGFVAEIGERLDHTAVEDGKVVAFEILDGSGARDGLYVDADVGNAGAKCGSGILGAHKGRQQTE